MFYQAPLHWLEQDWPLSASFGIAEAERNGLRYAYLPVTSSTITAADLVAFDKLVADNPKPILAHCRSGTRCSQVTCRVDPQHQQRQVQLLQHLLTGSGQVFALRQLQRLHRIAQEYLRQHSGDLCAPKTCDQYFIHGLSHWLGMDVHDVGNIQTPLAPGMSATCPFRSIMRGAFLFFSRSRYAPARR